MQHGVPTVRLVHQLALPQCRMENEPEHLLIMDTMG